MGRGQAWMAAVSRFEFDVFSSDRAALDSLRHSEPEGWRQFFVLPDHGSVAKAVRHPRATANYVILLGGGDLVARPLFESLRALMQVGTQVVCLTDYPMKLGTHQFGRPPLVIAKGWLRRAGGLDDQFETLEAQQHDILQKALTSKAKVESIERGVMPSNTTISERDRRVFNAKWKIR